MTCKNKYLKCTNFCPNSSQNFWKALLQEIKSSQNIWKALIYENKSSRNMT